MIIKRIVLLSLITVASACSLTPTQQQPTTQQVSQQPITQIMSAFLSICKNETAKPHIENQQLAGFIREFCATDSTNKQLKLISEIETTSNWPNDYKTWFASLTWHTKNLREQKITNFYSDSKAQKHEQQLLELQKQLIELKHKLVDIERQRLESSL
jgi:hypothetical protein